MSFGERFLVNPDLFPARVAGETWGSESVRINVASGPFVLTGINAKQAQAVRDLYGELCDEPAGHSAQSGLTLRVFRAYPHELHRILREPTVHPIDVMYLPGAIRVAGLHFMALFHGRPFTECGIWVLNESSISSRLVIENTLRIAVAFRLQDRGGVLLHSAGLVESDEACIFFGHSGAGKTTICRLGMERGLHVLSDDLNALFVEDGRVFVEKMPFSGELGEVSGTRGRYPVRGIFLLCKGLKSHLTTLPMAKAVARLYGSAPFVNADDTVADQVLANIENLAKSTDVQQLTFTLNEDFWPLLGYTSINASTPSKL
jgi:hypothetical protein